MPAGQSNPQFSYFDEDLTRYYVNLLYSGSASAQALISDFASNHELRFHQTNAGNPGFFAENTATNTFLVGLNYAEIANSYYFTREGNFVSELAVLTVAHELGHYWHSGDPGDNISSESALETAMNGAAFDFDGDIIRFQNTVARELGANQEQASYHSFMSGTDSRFGEFHVGHNYSFGEDVEIVRIGDRPGHTVDNMDMSNRTDSPTTLMFGFSGNDTLRGSDGVDILYGGAGADRLYGGQGNDFLVFDGADRTIDGGDGFDTAVFATVYAADGSAQGQTIDVTRYRNATIERVYGTEGDDVVAIGDGDYVFDGRGGDDHITVSGRSAITIEFGVGGGHDYVEGIFMEKHDFNAQVLHGQGPNTWFPDRENDTIRFVDLMPSDVSLVWNYTTQVIDVFGRESRDGGFAIVINETGESIQFAELFRNFDTNSYGIMQYACYGQYARNSDMYEDDPDNYLYSGPDGIDNRTHYDLFEFADGQRYSLFDLFDLLATQSSALPASRANPNAASSAANADFASAFEMHVSNPMATNLALKISTGWEPIDQICVV